MPITTEQLYKAYLAYFGRPPDVTGLAAFANSSEAEVVAAFSASQESQDLFGSLGAEAQINAIYNNLFGRDAEPAGLDFWLGQLESGSFSLAEMALAVLDGAQGTDATTVDNKVVAMQAFVADLDTTFEQVSYSGNAAAAQGRAFLATVGSSDESLAASLAGVDAAVAAAVSAGNSTAPAGQTFTLTEIPSQTETTLILGDNGVPADMVLSFLQDVANLDLASLGLLDENGNLSGDIASINIVDNTDGTAQVIINAGDDAIDAWVDGHLALFTEVLFSAHLDTEETITQTGIVLTPSENNGGSFESGFTSSANDLIIAGRTELLHGAYIDGGAGYNTLVVDMKGFYAQPFQLLNIQEVQVQNLTNVYNVDQTIFADEFNFPISDIDSGDDSILDLSRASSLDKLVITEGLNNGDLYITGIQNYATARLEGSFGEEVNLFYGRGQGDLLTIELANVSFDHTFSVNQNVGAVHLVSEGRVNTLDDIDFGGNFIELTVSGSGLLSIEDDLEFGFGSATIDASANTGGVRLALNTQLGFGQLEEISITGSQARDVFNINSAAQNGVMLNIDTGAGRDTLKISTALSAGQGSVITGENLTVEVLALADLRETDVSGVDRFVLDAAGGLLLMQDQVTELGAGVFVAAFNDVPVLSIEVDQAGTVLSDLIDLAALDSDVKLAFNVKAGASLEMTAEQLHTFLSANGVVGEGTLTITDAGLGFDIEDAANAIGDGVGTVGTIDDDGTVIVERAADGFERPVPAPDSDTLIIDTTGTGGVVVGANDISDDDAFSTAATTVTIRGDDDITFSVPVEMTTADFTLDFSALTGALNNLTIRDFQNVEEVIGNGAADLRINVELEGDVATLGPDSGLMSSGVAQYVVTDMDADYDFHLCDNTQDVQVIGLQGNAGSTLTFTNVPWGAVNPTILFEGDGFGNWDQLPKAAGNPDASNVGTIVAEYFFDGAPANVLITNQGVDPGLTSTGDARPIVIDGIEVENAASLNITVEDGNGVISSIDGDAGLDDVTLTSANDVTLHLDQSFESIDASAVVGTMTLHIEGDTNFSDTVLTGIDAVVLENAVEVTLTLDQITDIGVANIGVENDGNTATLNIGNYDGSAFDFSSLALDGITIDTVTFAEGEDITVDPATDFTGVTTLVVPTGTTVVMSAAQFKQLVDSNAVIQTGPESALDAGDAGAVTVDLNGDLTIGQDDEDAIGAANVTFQVADGETLNVSDFTLADGLQVQGDAAAVTKPLVNFTFTFVSEGVAITETIDVADYQDVDLRILDDLLNQFDTQSIEDLLENLASANILNIYRDDIVVVLDPRDRDVVVEPNAVVNGIEFSAVGALADFVRSIDLTLQANATDSATINGNITVNDADVVAGFTTLTINAADVDGAAAAPVEINGNILSNGAAAGDEGELTSVVVNAEADIVVNGTIIFNSLVAESEATLTLTGAGDITIDALNVTDGDIDTLNIVNNATGVVNVPGASPASSFNTTGLPTSSLVITGTGDALNFGTADDAATAMVDESNSGIALGDLETIDASGYAGDLDLGIVTGTVVDSLTITGSQGVTTLTLGAAFDSGANNVFAMDATDDVTIDLSGSAAGSTVTITSDAVLPNMTGEAAATAGSLVISTPVLVIEGNVDLRQLVDVDGNNKLDLSGVTGIQLAAGASLRLTDGQWADLTPAQQAAITGAGITLQVTDANDGEFDDGFATINLTDVRGTTAVQIDEALATLVVTEAMASTVTTGTFDVDGVFTATQWDHDANGATADIARVAGDFRDYAGNVVVMVEGAGQDTSALLGVDSIRIIESDAADTALTVSEEQVGIVATGTDAGVTSVVPADVLEELSSLTVAVSVDTGNTDIEGNPLIVASSFNITNDGLGNADSITASGNAAAIGTAQLGASAAAVNGLLDEAQTVTWNAVGTTASMKLADGVAVDLAAAAGNDIFVFAANLDTDLTSQLTIGGFNASGTDVINFAALEGATGAVVVSLDSGDLDPFALAENALYLIAAGGLTAADAEAAIAAEDADGITELAVGESAYFFTTNGGFTAIFEYTEAAVAGVQAVELTLIGTVDASLVAANIVLV